MSSQRRATRISILTVATAALLAACGGGGSSGGGGGASVVPSPPAPAPAPPPPPENQGPVVNLPITNQRGVALHAFDFDFSQGGRTFTDADGDELTYSVHFDVDGIGGLSAQGAHIVGTPQNAGLAVLTVEAFDGIAGHGANTQFAIIVDSNSAPVVVAAPEDHLVAIGAAVDLEATNGGGIFQDVDGDALTYEVQVRGAPGLAVSGTHVQGSLAGVGATEVAVTARDGHGGEGLATFLVAAPAPEPGAPMLPATSYVYEDELLKAGLPYIMSLDFGLDAAMPAPNIPTNAGATLGRVLFYDKRLSITNTVACATCHQQSHGFSSPNRFDVGVLGIPLKRNTMTLTNVRNNRVNGFFSDLRARSVQEVARSALTTADEMGARLSLVETKLRATSFYAPLFAAAFGTTEITGDRVLQALEQYVRTVLSYRSRFDQVCLSTSAVVPVDCTAGFTAQELRGQELFEQNDGVPCTMCHGRWTGTNIWHANNGIDDVITDPGVLGPDMRRDGSLGVFRAASLRNIARTAPYMHDGRFATLREVIDHYDHGIKASANLDAILGGSGTPRRMDLSEEDKDALEAFLRSFTDEEMIADPKFSDPFL
jgi:cytochrome c peroxidase